MRVLVINPPNSPFTEKSLLIEPIDVLTLATYLQHKDHNVRVCDMDVKQLSPEEIEATISLFMPEVVIIPFDYHIPLHTTQAIQGIQKIAQIARMYGAHIVIGGKTAMYHPDEFTWSDVIVCGEMELTVEELLDLDVWNICSLRGVKGIFYNEAGKMIRNSCRNEVLDLDKIPIIDRTLLDLKDYIDVRTIWTSRGCTGSCSFCVTPSYWRCWRGMSPGRVVDEIECLVRNGAKKVLFLDDNASADQKRMRAICHEVIIRSIDVTLGCLGTIASVDSKTLELMHEAGFRWMHFGAESGSQKVLDSIGKCITLDQMKGTVQKARDVGLRVRTSWIFNLPGMDDKALEETVDMILALEPEEIRAHFLALRAGTIFDEDNLVSQYIHNSDVADDKVMAHITRLVRELECKGYLIIKKANEWRNLKKLRKKDPNLRFISFCPARYGLWGV